MPFSIRTALDRIVAIQDGLTIASPIAAEILHVYKYPPPPKTALEPPCFMNSAELIEYERGMLRQRTYAVRMQLFVQDADPDRAGDIALAFQDQLGAALDNDLTLAATCTLWRNLRGGVRLLEWNGSGYLGLDLFMDVVLGGEVPGT